MAEGWGRILLEVVTPERQVLSVEVDEVTAPGADGYFGVLPGHLPFITTLGLGELGYRIGNQWEYLALTWGYAEVLPNQVTILTQTAEMAEEIDMERAERAKRRAEERLREWSTTTADLDFERASMALQRAATRLQVAGSASVWAVHGGQIRESVLSSKQLPMFLSAVGLFYAYVFSPPS